MKILISIVFVFVYSICSAQDGRSFNSSETLDYINKTLKENPPYKESGTKEEYYQVSVSGNQLIIYKYETDFLDKSYLYCVKNEFSLSDKISFQINSTYNGYAMGIAVFGKFRWGNCKEDISYKTMKPSNTNIYAKACAVPVSQCPLIKSLFNSLNHLLEELEKEGKYKPVIASDPFNYDK